MKIGIIVHSQTEHTYSVAQKLREKLLSVGHEANVERVIPVGDVAPGAKDIKFENQPDSRVYDALIFWGPSTCIFSFSSHESLFEAFIFPSK